MTPVLKFAHLTSEHVLLASISLVRFVKSSRMVKQEQKCFFLQQIVLCALTKILPENVAGFLVFLLLQKNTYKILAFVDSQFFGATINTQDIDTSLL